MSPDADARRRAWALYRDRHAHWPDTFEDCDASPIVRAALSAYARMIESGSPAFNRRPRPLGTADLIDRAAQARAEDERQITRRLSGKDRASGERDDD